MKAMDVMGFAGSMAIGVDQAGFDIVGKREPSSFKGFGVESMTYNMPWVEAQVSEAADWDMPVEPVDLVYGCPPCSGFSQLSAINTKVYEHTGTTYRGADAEINECMGWFIDYAARVKPRIMIMESVGPAFTLGREWMESLWQKLRDQSGLPYKLAHVNMNAMHVGGDVRRPRYFFVAHLDPFGIGLEFVEPRTMMEVIGDLAGHESMDDSDWAHYPVQSGGGERITKTIEWLESIGRTWEPGTRLPENTEGLEPPLYWRKPKPAISKRGFDPNIYSHWFSTDPFSPVRWKPDKPFGVIVAASLDRAIHPTQPRAITFREAARFMTIPDTWSMRVIAEKRKHAEVGKAVPTASAKWIAHWARMALEGTPGEYAGEDTDNPDIRVFNVQKPKDIKRHQDGQLTTLDAFHETYSDPDPSLWLVDLKERPDEWYQRDDDLGIFANVAPKRKQTSPRTGSKQRPQATKRVVSNGTRLVIDRIPPEQVQALLDAQGLTKTEAAEKLGVSVSRINELVGTKRPGSHLNADRWDEVQATLRS